MNKSDLEDVWNRVSSLTLQTPSVKRLGNDLLNEYYLKYESLGPRERAAWDDVLEKRLVWMFRSVDHAKCEAILKRVRDVKAGGQSVRQVHFGQLRAAANYQSSFTIYSVQEVAGRAITEVAAEIADGTIPRDLLTVRIFFHSGVWVAVNNRSLAAHSLAATQPIRLIPCLPSTPEVNRLTEVETLSLAPSESRFKSDRQRFEEAGIPMPPSAETLLPASTLSGRTLPSPLLPLTPGPEDKRVLGVVRSSME